MVLTPVNWVAPVTDYCERQGPGLFAEPLNAWSNVAFLVAAAAGFFLWRQRRDDDPALALVVLTGAVGVGSFIFHTIATRAAMLFDVVPIALFIYGYFFLALRRFFRLGAAAAAALTLLLAAVHEMSEFWAGDALNGSAAYLPALGALIGLAALLRPGAALSMEERRRRDAARGLATAAFVFAVSLFFRTVDRGVCASFPPGAHFIWHLLNALTLWLLLRTAILAEP